MALSTAWQRLVVATCRQTVEAFLAPLSTAWERVATGQRVATGRRVAYTLISFRLCREAIRRTRGRRV